MITKIQSWGNSQGIRLNKQMLADLGINVGDEIKASIKNDSIVLTPVQPVRGKYDLHDLVKQIPKEEQVVEVDWGKPEGKEVW